VGIERLIVMAALLGIASAAFADDVAKFALVARDGVFTPKGLEVPANFGSSICLTTLCKGDEGSK